MKKKLMIPGIVVGMLLLFGIVYMMFLKPAPPAPDEAELKKTEGPIYEMPEAFVVNLSGGESSFAKIGVALHLSEYSAGELPAGGAHGGSSDTPVTIHDDPIIRDIVIDEVQQASSEELRSEKGRQELKEHIKKRINKDTHTYITDVYWTEFAVQ